MLWIQTLIDSIKWNVACCLSRVAWKLEKMGMHVHTSVASLLYLDMFYSFRLRSGASGYVSSMVEWSSVVFHLQCLCWDRKQFQLRLQYSDLRYLTMFSILRFSGNLPLPDIFKWYAEKSALQNNKHGVIADTKITQVGHLIYQKN